MAASTKFDMSSSSPDRQLYMQRGSNTAASFDRLGSFRENMEHPILSSLPSMSRSSSSTTQGDVVSFLQCLRFDPKSMAQEHKFNRQLEFKRLASVAFGLSPDGSPAGPLKGKLLPSPCLDDLKRFKAGLREIPSKARERVKIFTEALSAVNKCFPSIPSRKRSRADVLTTDRSNALLSSERSILSSGMGKMGAQSHTITSGFELESQRSEERAKLPIPNKRTRTSMMDMKTEVRPNTPARPSGNMDREKETLRFSNSGAAQGEDRTLSIGVNGWEKSKMKKKRSGIKPDVSSSTGTTKPIEGYREPKQGIQPKLVADGRSRLNDSHGPRSGVSNGAVGVGKFDSLSQPAGPGMRASVPRSDQDSSSLLHDRRERPASSEKERVNFKAVSKTSAREDFNSTSPTPITKMNSAARAPRSASNVVPKLSPVQRSTIADDWELSQCTNKHTATGGANHRKRMPSARSSSPPVTHWAGQRPQKISRMARRTDFVPIVSNNEENSALDAASDVTGNESGSSNARRTLGNSPHQVKSKADHTSTNSLSESEESGAAETKCREKGKKSDEMDEKASQNVQKVPTLVLPPRKSKLVGGDDLGDGVRRQGRSGRGHTSTRSLMPTVEKLGKGGTTKQLRSARLGLDKIESKAGRPPTRKLSDRKAYTRQKHTTINASADFLVGSDDGNEELLAAAAAVSNPANCSSGPFWRQMEPFFGFISDADIAYLKQQGNFGSAARMTTSLSLEINSSNAARNRYGFMETTRETNEQRGSELIPGNLGLGMRSPKEVPLCQRLIAALISEEHEEFLYNENGDIGYDVYGCRFDLEAELESNSLNNQSRGNFQVTGHAGYASYGEIVNNSSCTEMELQVQNTEAGIILNFDRAQNGLISDQSVTPHTACSEFQYDHMSLNERVLLELQSIGLYPEPVAGDEEISEDISRLEYKYHEQISKKKDLFSRLLNMAVETREHQEKEFEQHALDKLVTMAYEKYMSCGVPKSASSKMAKQAALAFMKRTLDRCHQYEDTDKSCFSEPIYRDMFLSASSYLNDAQPDAAIDGESGKQGVSTPGCSLEVRVSAPLSTHQGPSLSNHDIYSSDAFLPVNCSTERHINEETWSTRVKKKEVLLDDVGMGVSSGIGGSLSSSAKGKRSERDREEKGNNREVLSRNGTSRIGRPSSGNSKGERKAKTKPKQKSTQLSASVNGPLGKITEHSKVTSSAASKLSDMATSGGAKDEFSLDVLDDDLSSLPIPEMDVLGVPDDLGGQGQDIASWLNFDDDAIQDHENYMGLEIPMDDLADLNMIV